MLVRVKASGCVEEVLDYVGKAMIAGGTAEPLRQSKPVEAAAIVPHKETAARGAVEFKRGPSSIARRVLGSIGL